MMQRGGSLRRNLLLAHSALYRLFRFGFLDRLARRPGGREERIRRLLGKVGEDTVEESFEKLAGLKRRHRFDVLVVLFPYLDNLVEYEHADHHEWVRGLSASHGFEHLDLLDTFILCQEESDESIVIDAVHPNFIGHYCAGWETARYIGERLGRGGPSRGRR